MGPRPGSGAAAASARAASRAPRRTPRPDSMGGPFSTAPSTTSSASLRPRPGLPAAPSSCRPAALNLARQHRARRVRRPGGTLVRVCRAATPPAASARVDRAKRRLDRAPTLLLISLWRAATVSISFAMMASATRFAFSAPRRAVCIASCSRPRTGFEVPLGVPVFSMFWRIHCSGAVPTTETKFNCAKPDLIRCHQPSGSG